MELTKEDILSGKNKTEKIILEDYDNKEIEIRPLTDGEQSELQALALKAVKDPKVLQNVKANVETGEMDLRGFDVYELMVNNNTSTQLGVSYGMVNPKLTTKEVGEMKSGVPKKILEKIMELTNKESDVESFPATAGSSGDDTLGRIGVQDMPKPE